MKTNHKKANGQKTTKEKKGKINKRILIKIKKLAKLLDEVN
jgi:hypothetical protein